MSLRALEIELNRFYDEIVARDDFVNLRAEQKKIETLFLSIADNYFGVSYSMSECLLRYSSVHDKFHRTLVLSGFFFLKIASTFLNSSFFPKPIKRRIAI